MRLTTQRLFNVWKNAGGPSLKPNAMTRRVRLLSDATIAPISDPLQLFGAVRGVDLTVDLPTFDSVEQDVFDPRSPIYTDPVDVVVLLLSDDWLIRYLGDDVLVRG